MNLLLMVLNESLSFCSLQHENFDGHPSSTHLVNRLGTRGFSHGSRAVSVVVSGAE